MSVASLRSDIPTRDVVKMEGSTSNSEIKKAPTIDIGLGVYFVLWYLGNYYYNITNKLALKVIQK
jgi:hypothetical protein